MSLRHARFFTILMALIAVTLGACAPADEDTASSEDALSFAPSVKGDVGGRIKDLTPQEALDLRVVSHDKILMWEGIVDHVGKPNAEVHLVDTKRFDGHLGYTQNALKRGAQYTENNFFSEIQYPAQRRYMPFFLFDFRSAPITIDGKSFKWVMNIRRYNYRDNEKQLADLLVTMRSLLGEHVMKEFGDPALFVYDSPPASFLRRPHVTQLTELKKRGFTAVTEPDMIKLAGGKLVAVLNPGVAYGYLKLVKAHAEAEAEQERLTPRHIAVFQDTPDRVPPVSGIVTLEPQTPLSHVNLLAKNRGTPNASTAQIALIPGMEALFDKLVRMEAKADGSVSFREAKIEEATAFWTEKQHNALEVPQVIPVSLDPVEFATADETSNALPNIGSKASNYAKIQKLLGASLVKPGFGLGFAHYRAIIAGAPAETLIRDLLAKKDTLKPEEIDAQLVAIRNAIQTQTPAANLVTTTQAVRAISAKLPGIARIRFRSSTNSEDLPVFNGAGLYESAGFDVADSDAKLQKKLLGVMASLWLERAFWERELFGIKHADVAMAILVNPAFSEELANGVVVGGPGADGKFASWVNAQAGEASVTNPLEGEIPESFTVVGAGQLSITKLDTRSNLGNIFLNVGADTIANDRAALLAQLHEATQKLHAFFVAERVADGDTQAYAIDLEYKLMKEGDTTKLYIKQSRLLALR